ncbi:hypothetical protein BJ875DRAFT_27427 [Amylocarpus encephaloides]|uniref:GYF domain-containing protein n=1 Tax=Amylocarpus encephaloides TaxID=45428 RepID=A0A9P7YJ84_9HELO|nr:hypothetical protein BJ875DRAFT_27427 [Amylocarpus encephaloides]
MPSHMPSSFASAAAGQGSSRDARSGRGDGRGSGDWVRRDSRATNGTLTLRRSSTTPFAQTSSQGEMLLPTPGPDMQSSQQTSMYEQSTDTRYSKNQLLDIYKGQEEVGVPQRDLSHLFINNWNPEHSNGTNGRSGWGKTNDGRDSYGPEICWDTHGNIRPMGLEEMSEQERILFAGDVNSPLKPPPQSASKDSTAPGLGPNGRKTSISQGANASSFGLSSPTTSRPSARRQQTGDSITGLPSPAGTGRFSREDSSFFSRKFNESKDMPEDRHEDPKSNLPFGGLMRSNTAGNTASSHWGPPSAGATMGQMGAFGSFALGGSSANPPIPSEKRPNFGRGESRLAHLMPKESSEDLSSKAAGSWRPTGRQRTDTDPFGDEPLTGSAAQGGQDTSPPRNRVPGLDTPIRDASGDLVMSDMQGFRDAQRSQTHHTPQGQREMNEPLSPSETNPYRSPPDDRHDVSEGNFEGESHPQSRLQGLGGIPEHGFSSFGGLPRGFSNIEGSDRSQTSSATGSKGFPSLGGLGSLSNLGGMGGWPTSANPVGTPDRENRPGFPGAFGNSIFGPMGDLQSPSLGGLGNMFGPGPPGTISGNNTAGRGSKLGSLFPAAMQAQMQSNENETPGEGGDGRQGAGFGAIGRNTFTPSRETDSPLRTGRHPFEDMFPTEPSRNQGTFLTSESGPSQSATAFGQTTSAQSGYQQSQASSDSASNQPPTAQQRMMVMPDRMRWVYLDPQGHIQGPWSGLEMHDWYKASFFTADLSVKKLEDPDFEPLGQLIRRIGNSREPFLVPQIGIPHGAPSTQAGASFTATATAPGNNNAAQGGSVQPPFAGAFPSFGTTLTAEQQNNLERRKQEEQYLMARQREFLAQQQVNMKQMQMGGLPSSLHHHSSAHSLQSQPSFGSIASPIGMPPQPPPLPGVSGFFEQSRQAPLQPGRSVDQLLIEEDMARVELERQKLFSIGEPTASSSSRASQIAAIFGQQPNMEMRQNDPQGHKARLQEFNQLREAFDREEETARVAASVPNEPMEPHQRAAPQYYQEPQHVEEEEKEPEMLSMTQQVQNAVSAKQSPISSQSDSPWAKVNTTLPMPFPPPPQSTTPLPAPKAQRSRSALPEALDVETRSLSETPEIMSGGPSLAPWAKEPADTPKHQSLKEIQEIEAKKAAKAEEVAAAARRLALEQEMKVLSAQPVTPAPGLPTSSTWGNTASPTGTTTTPSAWAKASSASKVQASSSTAASKKTLADIQREEENRKNKLAAAAAAAQPVAVSGGKRYADLASKASAPQSVVGSAWATVGAGGKVRIPTGPATVVPPPAAVRAVSSANITAAANSRPVRPAVASRSVTSSATTGTTSASEEFTKWAKGSLAKGLNTDINVDNFVGMLLACPSDLSIISEAVYGSSQLMDGRHFAEEFIRRRKLADKGVVEPANTGSGTSFSTAGEKSSGGWNEVAKKGPPKGEEPSAITGFKVVPNKKKGKK